MFVGKLSGRFCDRNLLRYVSKEHEWHLASGIVNKGHAAEFCGVRRGAPCVLTLHATILARSPQVVYDVPLDCFHLPLAALPKGSGQRPSKKRLSVLSHQ